MWQLPQRSNSSRHNWPHPMMLPAKRIISEQSYFEFRHWQTSQTVHQRKKKVQLQSFWLSKYIFNYKYAERCIFICLFFPSFSTPPAVTRASGRHRKCILTWTMVILISGFECLRFVFGLGKKNYLIFNMWINALLAGGDH